METKLTLRMDDKLIARAKKYAQKHGTSLSKLVADYFKIIAGEKKHEVDRSTILSEITGVLQKSQQKDWKDSYGKHLERKYL